MDDKRIIELFFARDEQAIELTKEKYGRHLSSLALKILGKRGAAEECENDTYYKAWNSIPPVRPISLCAYLSKIIRNLAINRLRDERRGRPLGMTVILDEISEIIPDARGELSEELDLRDAIKGFVRGLDPTRRNLFLMRYFYMASIKDISAEMDMSEGTVKSHLHRIRNELRNYLTERGIEI